MWPTKDVAFRDPERRRWEQLFPDHGTVMLEGAGHYIQEDAAEEIVAGSGMAAGEMPAALRPWDISRLH